MDLRNNLRPEKKFWDWKQKFYHLVSKNPQNSWWCVGFSLRTLINKSETFLQSYNICYTKNQSGWQHLICWSYCNNTYAVQCSGPETTDHLQYSCSDLLQTVTKQTTNQPLFHHFEKFYLKLPRCRWPWQSSHDNQTVLWYNLSWTVCRPTVNQENMMQQRRRTIKMLTSQFVSRKWPLMGHSLGQLGFQNIPI